MNSIRKFLKSKTPTEAIDNISFNVFNIAAFILFCLFISMPVFRFVYNLTIVDLFPPSWYSCNYYVLGIGAIFLILYISKIIRAKKYRSIYECYNNNKAFILFSIFILLMIISTAVNGFTALGMFGSSYRREGLLTYLSYFVYFCLAYISSNKKLIKAFMYIFTSSAVILEIFPIIDYFTGANRFSINGSRYLFLQFNHYGYYLLMSMITAAMLFITEKKLWLKIISIIEFAIAVFGLLCNDTFGCQLAAIVALVFIVIVYSLHKCKFMLITLVPIVIYGLTTLFGCAVSDGIKSCVTNNFYQLINDTDALANGLDEAERSTGVARIILWQNTLDYISEKPFLGFAADGTGERLLEATNDNDRCHCEYLQYAVDYGIPAAVFYIAGIMTIYLRGLMRRKKLSQFNLVGLCVGFAYLASAVIGNSMYYTAPFLFIMLGFGYSTYSPEDENSNYDTLENSLQELLETADED